MIPECCLLAPTIMTVTPNNYTRHAWEFGHCPAITGPIVLRRGVYSLIGRKVSQGQGVSISFLIVCQYVLCVFELLSGKDLLRSLYQ